MSNITTKKNYFIFFYIFIVNKWRDFRYKETSGVTQSNIYLYSTKNTKSSCSKEILEEIIFGHGFVQRNLWEGGGAPFRWPYDPDLYYWPLIKVYIARSWFRMFTFVYLIKGRYEAGEYVSMYKIKKRNYLLLYRKVFV